MTGIVCCARASNGQAAAAPTKQPMKSRRLMLPSRTGWMLLKVDYAETAGKLKRCPREN
jgi:hypothetical protein